MLTEGAKNDSGPWLSLVLGWGSLTMTSTGTFLYMAHHFILLRLNPFGLGVDREGEMVTWPLCVIVAGLLVRRGY